MGWREAVSGESQNVEFRSLRKAYLNNSKFSMSVNLVRKFVINRLFELENAGRKVSLEIFFYMDPSKYLKHCGILPVISAPDFKF